MDLADRLTTWTIWLLVIGGGVVREVLGQTKVFDMGAYTFHSIDPAIVMAGAAALVHLARGRMRMHGYTPPIIAMALLISINFVRGLGDDPAAALLWMRANGGIATILLLAVVMRPTVTILNAARNALITAAVLLSVLIALRLATHPTLFMTADFTDLDANDGGRALSAFGTFLMVLASGLLTSEFLQQKGITLNGRTLLTLALPIFVLLTEQGTVNIAEFTVLACVILLQKGKSRRERIGLAIAVFLILLAILLFVVPELSYGDLLIRRTNNLQTRQEVWDDLLAIWPHLSAGLQLFGYPAGDSPLLYIGDQAWSNSIHSMYFGSLPMMGYIGAFCFVLLLVMLVSTTFVRALRRVRTIPAYPLAFCLASAILSYSYELRGEDLLGLFIAIWWLRVSGPTRTRSPIRRDADRFLSSGLRSVEFGVRPAQRLGDRPPMPSKPLA